MDIFKTIREQIGSINKDSKENKNTYSKSDMLILEAKRSGLVFAMREIEKQNRRLPIEQVLETVYNESTNYNDLADIVMKIKDRLEDQFCEEPPLHSQGVTIGMAFDLAERIEDFDK